MTKRDLLSRDDLTRADIDLILAAILHREIMGYSDSASEVA